MSRGSRKIRRAGKSTKGAARQLGALQGATEQLGKLSGLAEIPAQLMAINDEVLETRALCEAVIEDYNELAAELEMQRAVSIRMAQEATREAVAMMNGSREPLNWIDREAELRAEYAAVMFLEWTTQQTR